MIPALAAELNDPRHPAYTRHGLAKLIQAHVLLISQGWRAQADADKLDADPVLACAHTDTRGAGVRDDWLPSQASLSRGLDILAQPGNAAALELAPMRLAGKRLRAMHDGRKPEVLTIDIDGLPLEAHGEQPGAVYNGHVGERVHYPLVASSAEYGDLLAARLREGNASAGAQAPVWIPHVATAAEHYCCRRARVRFDAGFTDGETMEALDRHGIEYVGRLRTNARLQRFAQPYLSRGPGRPPTRPVEHVIESSYQAEGWKRARRLVMVVTKRPGQLFNDVFFLITNIPPERCSGEGLVALYRRRGQAESCMGELKSGFGSSLPSTTRLSSSEAAAFARSQALLSLRLLAYEAVHLKRTLLERATAEGWSLRRVREQVLKAGTRVLRHARQLLIITSPNAVRLWRPLIEQLERLRLAPG